MGPRRPEDRNRSFEERLQVPKQPGYSGAPLVAGWIAVLLVTGSAAASSTVLLAFGLALWAVAVGIGLPAVVGRVETVVEDGDLFVTLGPEWLSGGEYVRLDAARIASVEVVENPVSDPPTDDGGEPLPGFDGEGRNTWPDASVGIPDRRGVVIRLDDGRPPEFPVVVPGEGLAGPLSVGRGPPGYVPSDRPGDLRRALAAARAASGEDGTGTVGRRRAKGAGRSEDAGRSRMTEFEVGGEWRPIGSSGANSDR